MTEDRPGEVSGSGEIYHATFGSGALLGQGVLVLRRGRVGGIGHDLGAYAGTYRDEPAGRQLALELAIRVPTATPIAVGLKAGPAGSTVHVKVDGPKPAPVQTYPVELAGQRGELTLELFAPLPASSAPQAPAAVTTDHGPPHADAFRDGVYRIESAGAGYLTRTVIVLDRGHLIGVGEMGGRYVGTYVFDPIRKLTAFSGHAHLPAGVPLVTGGFAGPEGLVIPIASETKFNGGGSRFSFSMAGRSVDGELVYQQPLPG